MITVKLRYYVKKELKVSTVPFADCPRTGELIRLKEDNRTILLKVRSVNWEGSEDHPDWCLFPVLDVDTIV